ncbi:dienelactone hydrolase [Bacillus sp. HNG]|uniref:alpha/beta hydrolase family protein n=1 Tax=Bacillus sp. HNG TaxID=2293325 RepID=UPI000E2F144E|nr:alpha/beta hydrolase family protein [Bacillus sp. HNG]RFB18388.1 dienelactone hydrolase [Bacillus sp. HNG]
MWVIHQFLDELYQDTVKRNPKTYDEDWQSSLTLKFQELLGSFKSDVSLQPTIIEQKVYDQYTRYSIEITTLPSVRLQMYVLVPNNLKGKKAPAILALHGHGYGNKDIVGLDPSGNDRKGDPGLHKDFAIELVKRGFVVMAPELIGFGERTYSIDKRQSPSDNSCYSLASQLLLFGKTLAGLRVFECQRVLDFMEDFKEVDSSRIGCMGISGGGLIAAFTTILDKRIQATAISGYTNTFKGSIMNRRHCLDNYIPGILQYAEMPELIALMVPRPLFIESGKMDHLFPVKETEKAIKDIKSIYSERNVDHLVKWHLFEGGHEICGDQSFEWLCSTLNPEEQ